jgi:hypothetical protein
MKIPAPDVPALATLPLYDLPESPPANGYSVERVPTFSRKSVWKRPVNILQGQSKKEVFSSFFKERLKI